MADLTEVKVVIDTAEAKAKLLELHELADSLLAKFDKLAKVDLAHEVKIQLRADDLIAAMRLQDYRTARTQ